MLSSFIDAINNDHSKVLPTSEWLTENSLKLYILRIGHGLDEKLQYNDNTYIYIACKNNTNYEPNYFFNFFFSKQGFHTSPVDVSYSKKCIIFTDELCDYFLKQEGLGNCDFKSVFESFCFVDEEDKQQNYHNEYGFRMIQSPSTPYLNRRCVVPVQIYIDNQPFLYALLPSKVLDSFNNSQIKVEKVNECKGIEFCLVNGRNLTFFPQCVTYFPDNSKTYCFLEPLNKRYNQIEAKMRAYKGWMQLDDEEVKDYNIANYENKKYTWFHLFLEMICIK